jgi:hypothetical protein
VYFKGGIRKFFFAESSQAMPFQSSGKGTLEKG